MVVVQDDQIVSLRKAFCDYSGLDLVDSFPVDSFSLHMHSFDHFFTISEAFRRSFSSLLVLPGEELNAFRSAIACVKSVFDTEIMATA